MNGTQRTNNTSGIFLAGLLVGGLVAALVSPRNGSELRGSLKQKIKDASDSMKRKGEETVDKTGEIIQNMDTK